jgi:hypothetical protein
MRGMFLHFINRVINPVVALKTENEILNFLDSTREYDESPSAFYKQNYEPIGEYYKRMGKHVRVIGFFYDKGEYNNEFRLFQESAPALSKRDDLRVGLVTN